MGVEKVMAWYKQALAAVRKAAGPGKGPWVIIHNGFLGLSAWAGFMSGSEQLMIGKLCRMQMNEKSCTLQLTISPFPSSHPKSDPHLFIAFDNKLMNMGRSTQLKLACEQWGSDSANSTVNFGPTMVGEFSVAVNDCTKYVNGIATGHRWDGTFPGRALTMATVLALIKTIHSFDAEYKTFPS
jgi:glucan 1,3-beta-glucosidase